VERDFSMPQKHKAVVERFVSACLVDDRIIAAFLGGSYATNKADHYSDIDLYLITTDAGYEAFLAQRETFLRMWAEPLSLEDFGSPYTYFFILADGVEGELLIGRESEFTNIHGGPYKVLLDKVGILTDIEFPMHKAEAADQLEKLQHQIDGFWHEFSHFIKAVGRNQLWFAYGTLEMLRTICVNLIRMKVDFLDPDVGDEPFFKIDTTFPVEQLAPLQPTYVPMEFDAILQAGQIIFDIYCDIAPALAKTHGLPYAVALERVMRAELTRLTQ
jgi:predicted nucleotidyltransferase